MTDIMAILIILPYYFIPIKLAQNNQTNIRNHFIETKQPSDYS